MRQGNACHVTVVEITGGALSLPGAASTTENDMLPNPSVRPVSTLVARVLRFLATQPREWVNCSVIAAALTESEGGKLKPVLPELVDMGWVLSGPAGYSLAVPAGATPSDYRATLLAWLAGLYPDMPPETTA